MVFEGSVSKCRRGWSTVQVGGGGRQLLLLASPPGTTAFAAQDACTRFPGRGPPDPGCFSAELAAHGNLVQGVAWSRDGALVGTVCKVGLRAPSPGALAALLILAVFVGVKGELSWTPPALWLGPATWKPPLSPSHLGLGSW